MQEPIRQEAVYERQERHKIRTVLSRSLWMFVDINTVCTVLVRKYREESSHE